jgi:hypothetical protein
MIRPTISFRLARTIIPWYAVHHQKSGIHMPRYCLTSRVQTPPIYAVRWQPYYRPSLCWLALINGSSPPVHILMVATEQFVPMLWVSLTTALLGGGLFHYVQLWFLVTYHSDSFVPDYNMYKCTFSGHDRSAKCQCALVTELFLVYWFRKVKTHIIPL